MHRANYIVFLHGIVYDRRCVERKSVRETQFISLRREKKDPKNDIDNKTLINFRSFYVHDNVNMVKHRR